MNRGRAAKGQEGQQLTGRYVKTITATPDGAEAARTFFHGVLRRHLPLRERIWNSTFRARSVFFFLYKPLLLTEWNHNSTSKVMKSILWFKRQKN